MTNPFSKVRRNIVHTVLDDEKHISLLRSV